MNTTHTPGNWYADGEMVFSEHGSRVADCTQNEEDFRVPSDSEIEANARLIAAAPDLLTALKPFSELLEYPEEVETDGEGFVTMKFQVMLADIKAAQAALKKAAQ